MTTPRLSPDMLARYDIAGRRPGRISAVQFGISDTLLGVVDRLIDDADAGLGIACLDADNTGRAERLRAQSGLYTVIVRGYESEAPVRREQVVQCVLDALPAAGADSLARNPDIVLGIVDDAPSARALSERFADLRRLAGLPPIPMLALGDCGAAEHCPMLAEGLAFRAEADEAARECSEMNYLDDMLHLAEPTARLTIQAPEALRRRFPLDRAAGISFTDAPGMAQARTLARRVFGAALFLLTGPGWLNGCDTLRDCMTHGRLRQFAGEAFTEELMPLLSDVPRPALEARVIETFSRLEDPLNRNRLLRTAHGLMGLIACDMLPLMRRWADENFEPPRRMAFALAAAIMLYAGARLNPASGQYEVARGRQSQPLCDDPDKLAIFATLSHDMPPETLAYAALADRELWDGQDLREIDGLEARVAMDIAAMQRQPGFIPQQGFAEK